MENQRQMTVNNRVLQVFKAIAMLLLLSSASLFAQNLIVNGDFEQTTGFNYNQISDYQRITGGAVESGRFIHDVTSTNHGSGTLGGWPANLKGYGGSGYYLLFNGFGGTVNQTKVAWRQTVNVTSQTTYTFSCQLRNLSQSFFGVNANTAIIRIKINGNTVGQDVTFSISNHDWQGVTRTWNSGNVSGPITIEIFDVFDGDPGSGDDFGLDHISFVPNVLYSVDAIDDWNVNACKNIPINIDVLGNDNIQPNLQDVVMSMVVEPQYGSYVVNNTNHYIQYQYTGGGNGTDQFKYRVNNHGVQDEAWVHINTGNPPQVGNITVSGPICAGGVLGIATPTVNPSATGHWERSTTANGTYQTFDPNNIPISMNGNYVRYSASNDCGEDHSNAVQITVTNGPTFSEPTPQIQPVCLGSSLNLTPPAFATNGSQILSQGWVASPTETGEYTTFNLGNITQSNGGWYIRYMVEGSCGFVYSSPARQLIINVAPDVTGTLQAPPAICAGDDLNVTPPTCDGNGTGAWEISQTQNGTYQSFSINNVPVTYNNWYLRYKVSNDCGNDVSNVVQIQVNDAPTIATPSTPQAICAGGSFNLTTPTIQNHGSTVTDQGWQIAATQYGTYDAFNNNNVPYTCNQYWIRYYAENECDRVYSSSVQVTVNDIPVVGAITAPAGICAGQSFNLTAPQVTWRHTNQGTGSWEIFVDGEWQALNNNGIPFSYNGCSIRYKAVNGCGVAYSTNTVQVTVYSTDSVEEGEITACDAIYHHGVLCGQNGIYVADSVTPNGCTIQVSWHFTLGEAYVAPVQYEEACDSYYWPKTHRTYYQSNVYDTLIISNNPQVCDSTFTLDLTINHAPTIVNELQTPADVCSGSPLIVTTPQFQMNYGGGGNQRWEYATSANGPFHPFDPETYHLDYGSYFLRFAVLNGCDSTFSNVVQFHVNDSPIVEGQVTAFQVCENNPLDLPDVSVSWRNTDVNDRVEEWQMANTQTGQYVGINPAMLMQMSHNGCWIRYYVHTSCGTDILGPVQINVLSAEDQWLEPITACDADTLETGVVITESQVVEYEVYEPCFHIVRQQVEINHSDYVVEPITSCHEEYEWHGRTFYHSDQMQYAWDTLTNVNLCDSIVELNLTFDEYSSFTHNRTACDEYVWEMKPNHTYTESTRDTVFVPAVNPEDCDTWYFLELTLGHDTIIDGGIVTECSGFVWQGVTYYEDAIIYDSLQTLVTQCDSIVRYQLNIIAPVESDTSIVSCKPIWWQEHYCEEEDDYQHVFKTVQGCDSIVTMHFSLTPEIVMPPQDVVECGPYYWSEGQQFIDEEGLWSYTFLTSQGCDSTVSLNVSFIQTDVLQYNLTVCDEYEFQGVEYDQPGFYQIYHDTVFAQSGCIAAYQILNLTVNNSDQSGTISGLSNVYVASNLISGNYLYELVGVTEVQGDIVWSISNSNWRIVETNDNYCRVFVGTPGTAILEAQFTTPSCGLVSRSFEINAGFFGVGDHDAVVADIYPNPTKGMLTVEAEGIESIRLTDMLGQVLDWREYDRSNTVVLNLNGFASSVYLLEIKTVNGMVKKRVMVSQ